MANETGSNHNSKGAWKVSKTIGGGQDTDWEYFWDPDATAMSEAEHQRLLALIFRPAVTALAESAATEPDDVVRHRIQDQCPLQATGHLHERGADTY
ncbi:hypothetical protein [Streptomyces sp. B6B3]|uniref:hypothetical protein n=1 Tax=Streptomyces sp. B6B3 TaxID=3153570 RepID=UPI00325EB561